MTTWVAPLPTFAVCATALGLAACQEPAVGVALVFPSERAFLAAASARVDVYDGSEVGERSPESICRSLSVNPPTPPAGVRPLASSGTTDVCELRGGRLQLEAVPVGRRLFFVEATDFNSTAILRGCTVADVFGDEASTGDDDDIRASELGVVALVRVQLATLPEFPAEAPGCANVAEKCEENVSCRP
jgi:hypothetical protein